MNIIQKTTPNFAVGRDGYKPEIIVLHIMAGSLASATSWFASSVSQASSHYGVGFKGEIYQYVKDEDVAWTQGLKIPPINKPPTFKLYKQGVNPNKYCLSIEHEGEDLSKAPESQLKASVELIQALSKKWGIPIDRDHIIGHYEVDPTRKPNCPATDKSIIDKIIAMAKTPTVDKEKSKKEIVRLLEDLKLKIQEL